VKKYTFVLFAAFFFAAHSPAQSSGWNLDKAHSGITFSVHHMVIAEVTGMFKDFTVTLSSSKNDFTDAAIDAAIAVKSVDTGNERRDAHLRTDDFFNAEKFPTIKFRSTAFEKVNDRSYKVKGLLTLRDTTKEVTIDATLNGTIVTSRGTRTGWKATLAINRFDYGVKWNSTIETGGLVAGDTVAVTFNLEFVK
jgi:polyisoprenoid-binding protein YceI